MATALKHHRRSHSASSSILRRSPGDSWRAATKRTHPQPFGVGPDLSSPQKWDVDSWRRGKRRRRNISPDSMDVDLCPSSSLSSPISAATPPTLPATSADFHLFPKNKHTTDRKRRATHRAESTLDLDLDTDALMRLHRDAFWQLRRSVEENGEGFVESMRVYETRRSRSNAVSPKQLKESQSRGRRRSPCHNTSASGTRDDSDDDDDIQIFAGERTNMIFGTRGKQRALSVGVTNEQPHQSAFDQSERCSSPGATCDSNSSIYPSDDECFLVAPPHSQPCPTLSHSLSTRSSVTSGSPLGPKATSPSSRSEKAIAALTLAMANGAGGLEDYEALRALHMLPQEAGTCEVGEMWH